MPDLEMALVLWSLDVNLIPTGIALLYCTGGILVLQCIDVCLYDMLLVPFLELPHFRQPLLFRYLGLFLQCYLLHANAQPCKRLQLSL